MFYNFMKLKIYNFSEIDKYEKHEKMLKIWKLIFLIKNKHKIT